MEIEVFQDAKDRFQHNLPIALEVMLSMFDIVEKAITVQPEAEKQVVVEKPKRAKAATVEA